VANPEAFDIPFVTLNPGASFRGLHDSLVNHGMNTKPQMLLWRRTELASAFTHEGQRAVLPPSTENTAPTT
jgi:acetolactate synthase-1/2/3 large subunit